jgi:hypothetical protein
MDKAFWLSVKKNDFALPAGHAVLPLTEELFSFLGSPDPELRDGIGFYAFNAWLGRELYSLDDKRSLIPRLIANWQMGLGETESDSVFLRSFSSLWLGLIIEYDNARPALQGEDIAPILEALLAYFPAERDLRGFDPVKGWAHAIAHAADLFAALACSPHTSADDRLRILNAIAARLIDSTDWVYLYGEDSRLAVAAVEILARGTLAVDQIKDWLAFLSADWNNSWWDEMRTRAFFNGRNFLRSLHYKLLAREDAPDKDVILQLMRGTLDHIQPFVPPE